MNVNDLIFNSFPREIGKKRIFVTNRNHFYYLANKYNGKTNLYSSIYSQPERRNYNNSIIDKIFFDFDNLTLENGIPKCWLSTLKFHDYLIKNDFKHIIIFSGRGFHVYVYIKPQKYLNPRLSISNIQKELAKNANIKIGDPHESDIDYHVIGDAARIARIVNTWNIKAKRYCIPLSSNELNMSYESICMLAEEQIFNFEVFGNKLLDASIICDIELKYDSQPIENSEVPKDAEFSNYLKLLPKFIQTLLLTTRCGYRERYYQILAMKECGFTENLCTAICKKYWTKSKFEHAVRDENQIKYIYGRNDLMFPRWDTIKSEGFKIENEDYYYCFYPKRGKL